MKLNKLVIACGVLFAAGAGTQAFAADGKVHLYVSGASALEISVQKAVAEMCDPALLVADRTFFRSANGNAYQCTSRTLHPSAPFTTAKVMDIRKRNGGGSGLGVMNVEQSILTGFTNPASAACVVAANVTIGGLTWQQKTGCAEENLVPHAGVSDVEPALFASQGYKGTLSASTPIVAQVFGVGVNDKLYRKLQVLQGISEASGFLPANAPSLTNAQVRSLYTSDYKDWTLVNAGITDAGNTTTAAKVCRRVPTAGTQSAFNALFLNNPCGFGPLGGALNPADNGGDDNTNNDAVVTNPASSNTSTLGTASYFAPTNPDGYTVVMNSGNGQVDACLTDANVKGELALGYLGTERLSGASPSDDADGIADQWHYVKLNGVYPSVDNTIASTYDSYAEATFNRRASGYTVDQVSLMGKLPVLMGNPATIVSENLLGLAALPVNGYDPTNAAHYPTLKGGRNGNTCQPTTLQF